MCVCVTVCVCVYVCTNVCTCVHMCICASSAIIVSIISLLLSAPLLHYRQAVCHMTSHDILSAILAVVLYVFIKLLVFYCALTYATMHT